MTRYHIPIAAFLVLLYVTALWPQTANAQIFPTQGEAYAECMSQPLPGTNVYYTNEIVCEPGTPNSTQTAQGATGGYQCVVEYTDVSSGSHVPGLDDNCGFFPYGNACAGLSGYSITADSNEPAPWCDNGCQFEATTGSYNSMTGFGIFQAEPTGAVCDEPPPPPEPDLPENCVRNESTGAIACDCSVTPDAPWCLNPPDDPIADGDVPPNCILVAGVLSCIGDGEPPVPPPPGDDDDDGFPGDPNDPPGDGPPGDGVPPPDGDTGDNDGLGDGDPDTPGDGPGGDPDDSTGTGDGDTDDDGERDIDCNPLSNPDCPFRGNAGSSVDCSSQPTCSGEPVACAILKQTWVAQCYAFTDNGSLIDPTYTEELTTVEDGQFFTGRVTEVDLGQLTIDSEGPLPGGSCPAAQTVPLPGGGTLTVPMDPICDLAILLSYLIMAAAYYVAFKIVAGAF